MLDGKSRNDVSSLVSARFNYATPLIAACLNGHLDVALYFIDEWNADVEQVGSIKFDGEIIEEAFPLWCASASGHLSIVEVLVKYNASVKSTTERNSTALSAACSYGQFEIAKFLIEHGADIKIAESGGHTCLMNACEEGHYEISKYLLGCGADINRKSDKGETALHLCAKSGSLDILKILLENGAKSLCDSYGTTPLLIAALAGYPQIVEYFIHEFICTKQEQVNALELLGSFFVKERDMDKAFDCWKRAMELRYEDAEFPLEKPITRSNIASCVAATEVRTVHQLEELATDPVEMCTQALLIVERIIGLPNHPYTFPYIVRNAALYRYNGDFDKSKKLWMYALNEELKIGNTHNRRIVTILSELVVVFSCMMDEGSQLDRGLEPVLFPDILQVFEICRRIVTETEKDDYCECIHHILITAILLVGSMCTLQPLNKYEDAELKKAVYKFVRLNPKGMNGSTLLHLACSAESSYVCELYVIKFPSTEVIDILLDVGACPNAIDVSNNTPLHVAAMSRPFDPAVFKTLVNRGAHLDFCNNERKTPLQLTENDPSLDVHPMHYINLQCLCAQAIRKHEIVYVGSVHEKLKEFLDSH